MIEMPDDSGEVPVVRTDFSSEEAWARLQVELAAEDYSGSGYEPNLEFIERRDLSKMDAATLEKAIPRKYPSSYAHPFLVVVDAVAVASPDHPVLLVDLSEEETSRSFRALPREVAAIEANLSIANMDFFEFGDNADDDGVFRGYN